MCIAFTEEKLAMLGQLDGGVLWFVEMNAGSEPQSQTLLPRLYSHSRKQLLRVYTLACLLYFFYVRLLYVMTFLVLLFIVLVLLLASVLNT